MGRHAAALLGAALVLVMGGLSASAASAATPTDDQRLVAAYVQRAPLLLADYRRLMSVTRTMLAVKPPERPDAGAVVAQAGRLLRRAQAFDNIVAPPAFRITSVTWPRTVVGGGAKGHLTIRWSGAPFFAVKVVCPPRRDTWPPGWVCTSPTTTFAKPLNPFVFRDAVWRTAVTRPTYLDYEVVLIDKAGVETAPYPAGVTCVPA